MTNEEIIKNMKIFRMQQCPTAPYAVFRDEELEALLKHRPKTIEELVLVRGFPADGARVRKHGLAIIEFFKSDCKIQSMDMF